MALSVKKDKNDLPTVVLYIFLVVAGMLMLYSVDRPPEGYNGDLLAILASPMGKQFIWLLLSLATWFVIHHFIDRDATLKRMLFPKKDT